MTTSDRELIVFLLFAVIASIRANTAYNRGSQKDYTLNTEIVWISVAAAVIRIFLNFCAMSVG